ncbi:hypothetical protein GOV10_05725 [Candidatus Woesearchaeota archaeon]|nr:hypothetical protein [Candidatus Woesearchaeota archaeon]
MEILFYDDIKGLTFVELEKKMSSIAKPVSEYSIADFIFYVGKALHPCTGLYAFFEGNVLMYIGKASSNSFVEQIPRHFDVRSGAWFNSLLKKMGTKKESYGEEAKRALKFRMALIAIEDSPVIPALESGLRRQLQPKYNKIRKYGPEVVEEYVAEYLDKR